MSPIYQEVHRWMGLPFIWGRSDCVLVLADWVQRVHGVDLAADYRETYDDRGSCQRTTRFFTEPVAFINKCVSPLGLEKVNAPQMGDIAVLEMRDEAGRVSPFGALWLGSAWACKGRLSIAADNGHCVTTIAPMVAGEPLAVWAVGYSE